MRTASRSRCCIIERGLPQVQAVALALMGPQNAARIVYPWISSGQAEVTSGCHD